jgi:hypothetical protein
MLATVGSERTLEDFAYMEETVLIEDPVLGHTVLAESGLNAWMFERIILVGLGALAEIWIQPNLEQPFVCFRDVLGSTLELL